MTSASPQDDGARARPRIGPVVVAGPRADDPTPAKGAVIPPLFVRSTPHVPAGDAHSTADLSAPEIAESPTFGSISGASPVSTPIAPEVDGDAAAVSDEPVSTEPVSTVQAPEISVSDLETSDPIPVQGLDDAMEATSTAASVAAGGRGAPRTRRSDTAAG